MSKIAKSIMTSDIEYAKSSRKVSTLQFCLNTTQFAHRSSK